MKIDEPIRNICVGDLYETISPNINEKILIEIIWIGIYEMCIDIYYHGKKKRRRKIRIYSNRYNINENTLVLEPVKIRYRDKYITEWKNEKTV